MATTSPEPRESVAERVAGGMLPRVLNTFDMVAIFVSIVLFITNAAVIQSAGTAAFGWWIIGFVAFLIPGAIVTGQLGRMFPGEGSIYLWTQKAFGPFWGFFAGFCACWPGVLVMVATGTVVLSYLGYVFPTTIGAASVQMQGVIIVGFIVLSAVLANQRFRLTQNVVNVVCILYGAAIGLVVIAGIVHLAGGTGPETKPDRLVGVGAVLGYRYQSCQLELFRRGRAGTARCRGAAQHGCRDQRGALHHAQPGVGIARGDGCLPARHMGGDGDGARGRRPVGSGDRTRDRCRQRAGRLARQAGRDPASRLLPLHHRRLQLLVRSPGFRLRARSTTSAVDGEGQQAQGAEQCGVGADHHRLVFRFGGLRRTPVDRLRRRQAVDIQTKAYDVLQAAVTVTWCISMVVLFVDVLIIIRRFLPRYEETKLARPAVFYTCAVIGGLSALVAVIATLSGSWTPLIANDSGSVSIGGAQIAYGVWFYLVAGIAVLSLLVAVGIYFLGRATSARAGKPQRSTRKGL